eukprot:4115388-Prymnesium_polylepis.1
MTAAVVTSVARRRSRISDPLRARDAGPPRSRCCGLRYTQRECSAQRLRHRADLRNGPKRPRYDRPTNRLVCKL